VQKATAQIPYTAEGLPVGFYRVDLLPQAPTSATEEVQALKNAYTDLSFEHGYPTLVDSRPFWHKLDFEPGFAYGSFQIYLDLINDGPREITSLSENTELHTLASRAQGLQDGQLIPKSALIRLVNEFSILYYWRPRAKAKDIYSEAAYRHLRLRRQMTVEDTHFGIADKLMKKLNADIFDAGEAFWAEMSPKTAVDLLKTLVAIQRVSTGLPAAGPLSQKETPEDVTFEMIMRTLGQKMGGSGNVFENSIVQGNGRELLANVLKDGNSAEQFQELIIRVQRAAQDTSILPNPHQGAQANRFKGRPKREITTEHAISSEDLIPFDMSGAPGENLDSADNGSTQKP
jgi:hypothetical protein